MEYGNYAESQKQEENLLKDAEHYIKVATNKKPALDYVEVIEMTTTSATVKVRAIDGDKENLIYKLFYGLDKENLEEKDRKDNVEEGQEIEFKITGIDTTKLYYFRIDVIDAYSEVQSQVSTLTNKKPVIEKEEVIEITRVSAKAIIKGMDEDKEDKLTYRIIYGTNKDILNTENKVVEKTNLELGVEETLEITDLKPGTKYYYKIEVTDRMQTAHTEIKEFDTVINNAPSVAVVEQTDINTNSFTITAKATDIDGDKLIYKVYTGNTKNNITNLHYISQATDSRNRSYEHTKYKCRRKYRLVL